LRSAGLALDCGPKCLTNSCFGTFSRSWTPAISETCPQLRQVTKRALPCCSLFHIYGTSADILYNYKCRDFPRAKARRHMRIQNSFVRTWFTVLVLSVILVLPGCGQSDKLDGVYANANGQNAIEFRGNKAFVTMVGMADPDGSPFDVKGTTITVHVGGIAGDLVLTRNSDGTLQGPLGIMKKKTG
jgi:hypothetical protein